jgi:hypothetical protein
MAVWQEFNDRWRQFILDPDLPMPIAMFSNRRIISSIRPRSPHVCGTFGAHIPLSWTQEIREAAKDSLCGCGRIEFNHFHPEYHRCSYRRRRNAIQPHTGTSHKDEIPPVQDAGFSPGYRLNAAYDLD